MQLEGFFESISYICIHLLPLVGLILLVYLIIMVKNIIICLKSATKTLDEANNQIRKLDVPLNTVSEISKSIDHVHDLTKESVKSISVSIYQGLNTVKEAVNRMLKKEDEVEKVNTTNEEVVSEDSQEEK